jgi:hypothetical protein
MHKIYKIASYFLEQKNCILGKIHERFLWMPVSGKSVLELNLDYKS